MTVHFACGAGAALATATGPATRARTAPTRARIVTRGRPAIRSSNRTWTRFAGADDSGTVEADSGRCSTARRARATAARIDRERGGGDGGESNSPSRTLRLGPATSVSDGFRRPVGRPSAGFRPAHLRDPRSGFAPDYVA